LWYGERARQGPRGKNDSGKKQVNVAPEKGQALSDGKLECGKKSYRKTKEIHVSGVTGSAKLRVENRGVSGGGELTRTSEKEDLGAKRHDLEGFRLGGKGTWGDNIRIAGTARGGKECRSGG